MNHEETRSPVAGVDTPPDTPLDTLLDTALSQYFRAEPEPDDDGFTARVMAIVPARAARRPIRWVEWVERAQWTAVSLASCGIAALMPTGDLPVDTAQWTAAYALIGLLIFWAVPSRWSRG